MSIMLEDARLKEVRQRSGVADLLEDMRLLKNGVLDWRSFLDGRQKHTDPVLVEIRDRFGNLKFRRYTHNLRTNVGSDWQAKLMGAGASGTTGSYTGSSATGLTVSGFSGTYLNQMVVVGGVYGIITATSATAITVDQWYNPTTQAVGTTPASSGTYTIVPGGAPCWWMALSNSNTAQANTDTGLGGTGSGEQTGTGVARVQATYSHTAYSGSGNNTYQLTHTYTNNTAGAVGPIYGAGAYTSANTNTGMMFENTFTQATLQVGDSISVTWTWTI